MNTRKYLHVLLLTFLFSAFIFLSGPISSSGENSEEKTYIFAGNDKFAPYSFTTREQNLAGFSVDLARILSVSINKNIQIKLMSWEECLSGLKAGTIDGVIGAPVYKERESFMDYSLPVTEIEFAIFVEASNHYVNSIKALEGTMVAVPEENLIIDELKKRPRIRFIKTASIEEALEKLENREVTAVIAEKNAALFYIQHKKRDKISGLKLAGSPIQPEYKYALATAKNRKELLQAINAGITLLEENQTLEKLRRKWFGFQLTQPFPLKMVILLTSGITGIMLLLAGLLWVISLNATVKLKTKQIQMMSQKMVEKDKLAVLGKLAGQIAHELRTPLSIINNSVFLLRKEGSENRELFEKRLKVLEEKIKLSSNILESILSYSRVKAEVATTISVKDCIEEVLKDIELPETITKEVLFENEDSLMVFMDFHQLYSVFRNIILNALQAMRIEGKLTITAFPSKDRMTVNIRVCDTGKGIMESARNKIFHLFYSTKITGTGLGLPISKSIIEANDGSLYLEETSPKGTCFMIKLPSTRTLIKK
ncbi:MAG: transporter substrate-binding domain-containing protein [Candidatus Omnitrophota bacterium]